MQALCLVFSVAISGSIDKKKDLMGFHQALYT